MKSACALIFLLLSAAVFAQSSIPAGTILPAMLNTDLNAGKLKPDQKISARIMQDIPGTKIHRGAQLIGHVISVTPTHLEIRFDAVSDHGKRIPITANLRALASMMEVDEARIPEGGADRSLPPDQRNSIQIGGDEVFRGGGPVTHGLDIVGKPTAHGVLGQVRSNPPCRGPIADNDRPQAFWRFSTNACGLYGFDNLRIEHAGRSNPIGAIALTATSGKLHIRSGSGILLRTDPNPDL